MSATSADEFFEALHTDPALQDAVEDDGIVDAARRAGFEITESDFENAVKAASHDDLPDYEIDDKENQACSGHSTCGFTSTPPPTGCRY